MSADGRNAPGPTNGTTDPGIAAGAPVGALPGDGWVAVKVGASGDPPRAAKAWGAAVGPVPALDPGVEPDAAGEAETEPAPVGAAATCTASSGRDRTTVG